MMALNTIKTVVYDNDGVSIDSEDLAMRIADDWVSNLVSQFSPLQPLETDYIYNKYAGKSTNKIVKEIIEEKSLPLDEIKSAYQLQNDTDIESVALALADLITIETINRFKQELKAVPGVVESHDSVRKLVGADNMVLATTSRSDRMNVSLDHAVDPTTGKNAGLSKTFTEGARRISGYGYPNKYDLAFSNLNLDPSTTVVVEDSTNGAAYAKAGRPDVRVIGTVAAKFYTDKDAQAKLLLNAGADVVVSRMDDLPLALVWLDDRFDPNRQPDGFKGRVYTNNDLGVLIDRAIFLIRAPI